MLRSERPARRRGIALAAAALILAACGGSDDDADTATTVASAEAATTTEAPATTAAPTTVAPETTAAPTTAAPETTAPATTAAPTTTEAPEEATTVWEPIGAGPFDVGVSTITVDDPAGERPLTVDVWYPLADGTDVAGLAPQQYTLLPTAYYESSAAFAATPDLIAPGPTPLVVYSHGSGVPRYIHSSFNEALASHGYVIAAPDHPGNGILERFAGEEFDIERIAIERPTDVGRVIDAFTDPAHPEAGPWAAQVDPERIGVAGQSFGGFTAVAIATGVTTDAGTFDADPRVDAIIPISPATNGDLLPDDVIDDVEIPMLVIGGTNDQTTPIDPNVTRLWDLNDNSPAYRLDVIDATHQTFSDLCAYTRFLPTIDGVPDIVVSTIDDFAGAGCTPDDIDDQRAAEITNTYAIQFLDEVLRDGPPVPDAAPDDVVFESR